MPTYGDPFYYLQQQANRILAMSKKTIQAPDPIELMHKQQKALLDAEMTLGIGMIDYGDVVEDEATSVMWGPKLGPQHYIPPDTQAVQKKMSHALAKKVMEEIYNNTFESYTMLDDLAPPPPPPAYVAPKPAVVDTPAGESGKFGRVVDLD